MNTTPELTEVLIGIQSALTELNAALAKAKTNTPAASPANYLNINIEKVGNSYLLRTHDGKGYYESRLLEEGEEISAVCRDLAAQAFKGE